MHRPLSQFIPPIRNLGNAVSPDNKQKGAGDVVMSYRFNVKSSAHGKRLEKEKGGH
jgi:hypothetical protein